MWILLSIAGAFFQALGAAIKKKSLQTPSINNSIGFISFTMAGMIFGALYFSQTGNIWQSDLSIRFWQGIVCGVGLNIIGVWFMYKALDSAEFNYLMPFMTLTSLSMIIPPIFLLGEIPNTKSILGIIMIVSGVLYMNYRPKQNIGVEEEKRKRDNRRGILYFTVTAICFTFTPTFAKVTIQESSVLFASFLIHLLIGLGFLVMIFIFRESKKAIELMSSKKCAVF